MDWFLTPNALNCLREASKTQSLRHSVDWSPVRVDISLARCSGRQHEYTGVGQLAWPPQVPLSQSVPDAHVPPTGCLVIALVLLERGMAASKDSSSSSTSPEPSSKSTKGMKSATTSTSASPRLTPQSISANYTIRSQLLGPAPEGIANRAMGVGSERRLSGRASGPWTGTQVFRNGKKLI